MATCLSEDESTTRQSKTQIDASSVIGIAVERCPLCSNSKRTYSCKDCIEQGNLTHSSGRNPERYAEKLQKLNRLKKERLKLSDQVSEALIGRVQYDQKRWDALFLEQKKEVLLKASEELRGYADKERNDLHAITEKKNNHIAQIRILKGKIYKYQKHLEQSRIHFRNSLAAKEQKEEDLARMRRSRIEELMTSIFPIMEIREADPENNRQSEEAENDGEKEGGLSTSTVSELAEAQQMSYIHGKWVYTGNHSKTNFTIITPEASLPGDGDYSAYTAWYETTRHFTPGPNTELGQRNPANSMCAALSNTTQLLSVLSYYLGIHSPKKICYGKFCGKELSPQSFSRAVANLNTNILHMCFTQNVSQELLHPMYTLRNILVCVKTRDLGRSGPFEVNSELIQTVEESSPPFYGFSDDSDNDSQGEDDVDLGGEWETVPRFSTSPDVAARLSETYTPPLQSQVIPEQGGPTSSELPTGGLMSSAAASVASLWRVATSTTGFTSQSPEKKS